MGSFASKEAASTNTPSTTTRKRGPPPAISATDRATLDLKNARDRLRKYKNKLEHDDAKIIARAKKAKAEGNTKAALNLLKIRKLKTREVDSCEAQLLNVMQMVQTIDSKQNEVQVLAAMKEGKDTLQRMHEETTVDDVLNLMDEIQEQNELEQEMNDILVGANVSSLTMEDDAAIEAELEALMGIAPTPQQPTAEQLPVAPVAEPLPQAPSTKLPEDAAATTAATAQEKVAMVAS
jgi:hydroxymethylglutaryl-CoA lyase/charged multivesicular body protein 6